MRKNKRKGLVNAWGLCYTIPMKTNIEKFNEGWFLSLIRTTPSRWMILTREEMSKFNFSEEHLSRNEINFKDARELLKSAQVLYSSDDKNDDGLPMVSIYGHKSIMSWS